MNASPLNDGLYSIAFLCMTIERGTLCSLPFPSNDRTHLHPRSRVFRTENSRCNGIHGCFTKITLLSALYTREPAKAVLVRISCANARNHQLISPPFEDTSFHFPRYFGQVPALCLKTFSRLHFFSFTRGSRIGSVASPPLV